MGNKIPGPGKYDLPDNKDKRSMVVYKKETTKAKIEKKEF